ncbi:MAG TPA: hypothetical protein VMN57_07670, partial [Anaerolineales bacterium]|nr:hypothetical protein [Anaerolineales bacterium]
MLIKLSQLQFATVLAEKMPQRPGQSFPEVFARPGIFPFIPFPADPDPCIRSNECENYGEAKLGDGGGGRSP